MATPAKQQAIPVVRQRPGVRFKGTGEVRIESLSHDARGVGHVEGKTVFVEGALPGERVRYGVLRAKPRYDTASTIEVLQASPDRVPVPRCVSYGICGGCSLQHLQEEAQLRYKQEVVAEVLQKIGKVEPATWLQAISGPAWGYRRKARLGARLVPKKGGLLLGFREKRSSYVTDIDDCHVLDPRVAHLLPDLRQLIAGLSCPDRIPQVEVAAGDDDVVLVIRHLVALTREDVDDIHRFAGDQGVQVWLQPGGADSIACLAPPDPRQLEYTLREFDVTIRFGPTDFTQVNADVNAKMVSRALALLDLAPEDRVLDLFCGLGNFTLPIARSCRHAHGIEGDDQLVQGACANARRNGIDNVSFATGDLYQESETVPWAGVVFNKMLIDPPRSGAIQALRHLTAPGPERIVYVSCYPATLAHDAEYLVHELGYRFEAACVMDMFPQTGHVESIALFVRD